MTNRFEQVDEAPDDVMTLTLKRDGEKNYGIVSRPRAAAGGRLLTDYTSDETPLKEAISSALKIANDFKAPFVVTGPDALWKSEWGTLYRDAGKPGPAEEGAL